MFPSQHMGFLRHLLAYCKRIDKGPIVSVQKFGVQVLPSQISEPAFLAAILEVLTTPSYADTAQAMSVKIRARKRTPVQEGAGNKVAQEINGLLTVVPILQSFALLKCLTLCGWLSLALGMQTG